MLRPASGRNTDRLYSNPAFFMCSAMMLFATWTLIAQACAFPAAFGDCLSTEYRGDTAPNEFCNSVASLFLNWDCDSGEKFKLGTSLGTLDWPWENRGCLYHAATCKDVFWARRLTSQAWPFSLSTREVVPDSFKPFILFRAHQQITVSLPTTFYFADSASSKWSAPQPREERKHTSEFLHLPYLRKQPYLLWLRIW